MLYEWSGVSRGLGRMAMGGGGEVAHIANGVSWLGRTRGGAY